MYDAQDLTANEYVDVTGTFTGTFNVRVTNTSQYYISDGAGDTPEDTIVGMDFEAFVKEVVVLDTDQLLFVKAPFDGVKIILNG